MTEKVGMYPVAKKEKEWLISLQNHRKLQELEAPGAPSENGGEGSIEKSKMCYIHIEEARWHSHTPISTTAENELFLLCRGSPESFWTGGLEELRAGVPQQKQRELSDSGCAESEPHSPFPCLAMGWERMGHCPALCHYMP